MFLHVSPQVNIAAHQVKRGCVPEALLFCDAGIVFLPGQIVSLSLLYAGHAACQSLCVLVLVEDAVG